MNNDEEVNLRSVYAEILQGYSYHKSPHFGGLFFKHLTPLDYSTIDITASLFYEEACNEGALTKKEKIALLKSEDMWPTDTEKRIFELKDILSRQKQSKGKFSIPSQIQAVQDQINKNTKDLEKLELEISNIVGYTAELYSIAKMNETYTYYCCYSDSNVDKLKFSKEEFDELNNLEVTSIVKSYNKVTSNLSSLNLRKIAISSFFTSYFSICKDNPFTFYGKPVCNLSNFQSELFVHGICFKNILNKHNSTDVPSDVINDPDKLIEWHEMTENSKNGGQNMGVDTTKNFTAIGATREDYKKMGLDDPNAIDLSKVAREKGGNLNMKEIYELTHGKGSLG